MLFTISEISANAIDSNNNTGINDSPYILKDIPEENNGQEQLAHALDNDELSANYVYFNSSAKTDGVGTRTNPYKIFKWNRVGSEDTAYFADGVYTIDSTKYLYSSFKSLNFIGQSSENTILKSINNNNEINVFEDVVFTIKDMTFEGVHIKNYGAVESSNVIFQNGIPAYHGGVIDSYGSFNLHATLKLTNCQFKNNSAKSNGGAISSTMSEVIVNNCIFYNSTSNKSGGAIYASYSDLTISNSIFNYNHARYGGAIYMDRGKLILKQSQLMFSTADSYGGSIGSYSSNIRIETSNFTDSESIDDAGGALYSISGVLNVYSSMFTNEKALFGGAICVLNAKSEIRDSNFTNNFANFFGGSIYSSYGDLIISKNNFKNSKAGNSGGSIYSGLTYSLYLSNNNFRNSSANIGYVISIDPIIKNNFEYYENNYDGAVFDLQDSYPFCFYNTNYYYEIDTNYSVPLLNYTPEVVTDLPSSYDSRDYGYITSVKNQGQGGNCWAFSGIATLEACLKKATGIDYDFSEENVKNLMALYSLYGWNIDVNMGGYMPMTIAYFMSWFGPVYDEMDKYDESSALSAIYNPLLHIQNVYEMPGNDIAKIKKAIVEYGAVSIGVDLAPHSGHALTLVGWDDNYTGVDYFNSHVEGAWIVKDSYGENWYDHGYYYLGFDKYIKYAFTFIFNDTTGYTDIYQYDLAGSANNFKNNYSAYKTKFTSRSDEILSAVAAYFDNETDYTIIVYKNGNQITVQKGHSLAGYMTIPLKEEIPLKKDDEFIVEFEINGCNIRACHYSLNGSPHINAITFGKGVSFAKHGEIWKDLYGDEDDSIHATACIKAYTRPASLNETTITMFTKFSQVKVNEEIIIIFDVPNQSRGFVVFSIDGQNHYAKIENGLACSNIIFNKKGNHTFKAQYKSNREVSNLISFSFEVVDEITMSEIAIMSSNVSTYYGGSQICIATVYGNGALQKGVDVEVTIEGKHQKIKTDSNGGVILSLNDFNIGSYIVAVEYNSIICTSKFTIESTIDCSSEYYDSVSSTLYATFLDADANPLRYKVVKFYVNDHVYEQKTNYLGFAAVKLDLNLGLNDVIVTNTYTGEDKVVNITKTKLDTLISLSIIINGNNITLMANLTPATVTGNVAFNISNSNYIIPIKEGKAKFTLDNLKTGLYFVFAQYKGDNDFNGASGSTIFAIESEELRIIFDNLNKFYHDSKAFAVCLVDNNGKPIASGEIIFKLYDENHAFLNQVSKRTNNNGYVSIDFNRKPGAYFVEINLGDGKYMGTAIIVVKKAKSILMVSKKTFKVRTKIKKYKVVLKITNYYLTHTKVTLKVGGKTYRAYTNSKGKATFKITKLNKKGRYVAVIKYNGNGYYYKSTKKVKIKVI